MKGERKSGYKRRLKVRDGVGSREILPQIKEINEVKVNWLRWKEWMHEPDWPVRCHGPTQEHWLVLPTRATRSPSHCPTIGWLESQAPQWLVLTLQHWRQRKTKYRYVDKWTTQRDKDKFVESSFSLIVGSIVIVLSGRQWRPAEITWPSEPGNHEAAPAH